MKANWYPGHIAKAKKTIKENLKLVDIILEVRDARIPESSKPEALEETIALKSKIIILNKKDLASKDITEKWSKYFLKSGFYVTSFSKDDKKDPDRIFKLIEKINENNLKEQKKSKATKIMIVGIPNVGKSTVLNQISHKKVARTGAVPGITRGKQWYKFKDKIHVLDTPGVLLPEYENIEVGYKLVVCEALDIDIFPVEQVCEWLFDKLKDLSPREIKERYKLNQLPDFPKLLEEIGRKRGALLRRGQIDYEKASKIFIKDFNKGKLGRVCLEDIQN